MKNKPSIVRSNDNCTCTFSLPRSLLEQIDACAKLDARTRSNWLVKILSEAVEARGFPLEKSGETKAEATAVERKTA
jgi:metal-responsive CopG/Arc/MetJ family transcriptional regulator